MSNIELKQRVWMCRLIEKMNLQESYSKSLGIENESTYHGNLVRKTNEGGDCYGKFESLEEKYEIYD